MVYDIYAVYTEYDIYVHRIPCTVLAISTRMCICGVDAVI